MTATHSRSVVFSPEEQKLIDSVAIDNTTPSMWGDERLSSVKSKIKRHYVQIQNRTCCYCNFTQLTSHGRAWDLDHVIPRSTHPQFMFEPINLAASCIDCNEAKGAKNVLTGNARKLCPKKSKRYRIVHPNIDVYHDHIGQIGPVYYGHTPKGVETIFICGLMRFSVEAGKLRSNIHDRRFEDEVGGLLFAADRLQARARLASLAVFVDALFPEGQPDALSTVGAPHDEASSCATDSGD